MDVQGDRPRQSERRRGQNHNGGQPGDRFGRGWEKVLLIDADAQCELDDDQATITHCHDGRRRRQDKRDDAQRVSVR